MKKLIIFGTCVLLASSATFYAWRSNLQSNTLLAMNLEALASGENESTSSEYHRGTTGRNWKTYTITCSSTWTVTNTSNSSDSNGGSTQVGVSDPTGTASGSVTASSNSSTSGGTTYTEYGCLKTWDKDVCGKGSGLCLDGAPKGNPCYDD